MSKKLSFFSLLGLLLCIPLTTLAMEKHANKVVFLAADQVINQNYYAVGENIEIYGTVNGDLFLAGGTVLLDSANINGDVFVVAENLVVKNKINGSVRAVTSKQTELSAEVLNNIFIAGENLKVYDTAIINKHLTFWGSNLEMNGKVGQQLEGAMENAVINGEVGSHVDLYLSPKEQSNLKLTDKAKVGGSVFYRALTKAEVNEAAKVGGSIDFQEWAKKQNDKGLKDYLWSLVLSFFGMLVVGMVLFYVWPGFFSDNFATLKLQPWKTLLFGFLSLILTPIIAIAAMFTLIGLPLGLMLVAVWLMFLYLATILSAWLVGKFIKSKILAKYKWSKINLLIFSLATYLLVIRIPFIGWLVALFAYLFAWGLLWSKIKFKK